MEHIEKIVTIGGRALVALLCILAGVAKAAHPYARTQEGVFTA